MKEKYSISIMRLLVGIQLGIFLVLSVGVSPAFAQVTTAVAVPGGSLDPLTIPKYVTPLIIPPVMPNDARGANNYDIAVREFTQQILPAGVYPQTKVWSYVSKSDPSTYNYPAFTIETTSGFPVNVRWRNELVVDPVACAVSATPASDPACYFLPHFLPVDQTLHWANPGQLLCMDGTPSTDCMPMANASSLQPYAGPVPIITHVHGAHVDPHSDGYPEAWYLPAASNIPTGYATNGKLFDDVNGAANPGNLGYADFRYRNDQPATTIWYHDHALGMTRTNVYAGPAGFWLIRGGANDGAIDGVGGGAAVLPGPAPKSLTLDAAHTVGNLNQPGNAARSSIREIPIVIQDRSFNTDGSLFYPTSRTFFDGYPGPYTGSSPISTDIAPIWNPEAFFNTMVVNGKSWPVMEVAPALYRFRLLNGCNSRFLNLALFEVALAPRGGSKKQKDKVARYGIELPFYQIGADQGFLPQVVMVKTGFQALLPGNGTIPALVAAPNPQVALLMGLAERADVIVDFRAFPVGTRIRMINTAPDAPFGGFPDVPADPATTGQVMEFIVTAGLLNASDALTTPPKNLVLNYEAALAAPTAPIRQVSLNEEMSGQVCVTVTPSGAIKVIAVSQNPLPEMQMMAFCSATMPPSIPMGPKAAKVGIVDLTNPAMPMGIPLNWTDMSGQSMTKTVTLQDLTTRDIMVTENPALNDIEEWEIYNFTVDSHPIHLHLVRFEVVSRTPIPGVVPAPVPVGVFPSETGFKDTVIAYPGEITKVKAKFDIAGLYVWHCHILEHEDNEMMRPYVVGP